MSPNGENMKVYVVKFDQDGDGHNYILGVYSNEQDAKFEVKHMIEKKYPRYDIYDFEIDEQELL